MSTENWRIEQDARDYFVNHDKRIATEERRPVIRKASDLVGPGIGSASTVITNYNDVLATFNGYFSSLSGAESAPNADEPFTGFVVNDAVLGGTQVFTGMVSGNEYKRIFNRNPADPATLGFSDWVVSTAVASLCKLGEWPLVTDVSVWNLAPVQVPQVRGNRVIYAGEGTIQVKADGWYDVGGQCAFVSNVARVDLRIVNGAGPEDTALVNLAADGGVVAPSVNGSTIAYLLTDTYVRMYVSASAATDTSNKFLYVREA